MDKSAAPMSEQAEARAAEYDFTDESEFDCHECGGEGFVSDCFEEWACVDPEYGCDLCTRRCDLCHPRQALTNGGTDEPR